MIKKLIPRKLENFFIRAKIRSTTTHERTHKNRKTKLMQTYAHAVPNVQFINRNNMASTKKEGEQIFTSEIVDSFDDAEPEYKKYQQINDVDIVQSVSQSSFSATATKSMMMRSAEVVNYNFIPHDDHLLKNQGFCVIDNFVGVQGKLITKLTVIM